jgi:regulator of PEP synthase PpsR (kinase-PPPase family)
VKIRPIFVNIKLKDMNKIKAMKERVQVLSEMLDLMEEIQDEMAMEKRLKELYGLHWDHKKLKEYNDRMDQLSFQLKSNYRTCVGLCETIKEVINL